MALNWQTLTVPIASGLAQKGDERALPGQALQIAKDLQFDESGGVQPRYQYDVYGTTFGGGDVRSAYVFDDELMLFTADTVRSLGRAATYSNRSTYLAVAHDEKTVLATTDDQRACDRAELSNVIVYAWQTSATQTVVAAVSKETGAVIAGPTSLTANRYRPRVVALDTKILLTIIDGASSNALKGYILDPTDVATGLATTPTTILAASNENYDVIKVPGADQAAGVIRLTPTTSYTVFTVTAGGTVATSTKAFTCTDAIACAITSDGATMQVIRGNGTNVQGDRITMSGLSTAASGQAIGTIASATVEQITCEYVSTTCHVFWHKVTSPSAGAINLTKYNTVTTGGTIGTQADFRNSLGIASRAFVYNSNVYFWGVFGTSSRFDATSSLPASSFSVAAQNVYLLYRHDGVLCGKAAFNKAEGYTPLASHLPGVALVSGTTGFAWCGTERRRVDLGGDSRTGYAARAPRDITFTFDSNDARRCARLGKTVYVAGSQIMQWDGESLTECNFHVYPFYFSAIDAGGGSVVTGSYGLKNSWRWMNARGEIERSSTATVGSVDITGGRIQWVNGLALNHTLKTSRPPAVEFWRTEVNPVADSPFYLVSSFDPAVTSNPNRYIANDHTLADLLSTDFHDDAADTSISILETHPENGAELENLPPPPARLIASNDVRLFLARIPGEPTRIYYSKQRIDGMVASFNDALVTEVPPEGGEITGISFLNETLIIFKETAIYALAGDGFTNTGEGANYGPARLIARDVGAVSQEAIGISDKGLFFKSSKGWYLLDRGWQTQYIGAAVVDYDSDTILGVDVMDSQHQIRCVSASRQLIFDTLAGQWAEWSIDTGVTPVGSDIYQNRHIIVATNGIRKQATTASSPEFGLEIETGWIKLTDIQGAARVRWCELLGEWLSDHSIRIRIAYNYDDSSYVDDSLITPTSSGVGQPLQVKFGLSRQQCESFKVRVSLHQEGDQENFPSGLGAKLTALSIEYGVKRGLYRRLPAASKT